MTKFERVLSDAELISATFKAEVEGTMGELRAVEQAVLAKLAEQEPVAYLFADMIYGTGDADINENIISKGEPLYDQPKPNHTADIRKAATPLTQRKIQSIIDSGEYHEMKGATVLVNKQGHAAIVNHGGAFYWVDNEALAREFDGAETKEKSK